MHWGPSHSDLTEQFYSWQIFIHRWFSRGVFPFWAPHVFSGYPAVESQQMLALNPVHLFSLLMPPGRGMVFQMVVHTVIAAVGTRLALWRWGRLTPMASAFGGILYVASAIFAVRVTAGHMTVIAAMAWWPMATLSLYRALRMVPPPGFSRIIGRATVLRGTVGRKVVFSYERRPWLGLVAISAVCHGMVILAGGPQYIAYLFYIDAVIVLTTTRWGRLAWNVVVAGMVWSLAMLMTAPQWLPTIWYLPFTSRAVSSPGTSQFNLRPLKNLWLEFIAAWPFGDDLTQGHLHFKNVWETATYPGAVALIVAGAVLVRLVMAVGQALRGARAAEGMAAGGRFKAGVTRFLNHIDLPPLGLAFLLIIGLGIYMMVGLWLPGFSGFRDVTKARAVVAFSLPILCAMVLDRAVVFPGRWMWPMVVSAAALVGMTIWIAVGTSALDFVRLLRNFGQPFDPLASGDYEAALVNPEPYLYLYQAAMLRTTLIAGVGLAVLITFRRRMAWAAAGLVLIGAADLTSAHWRAWQPRHLFAQAEPPQEIFDYFRDRVPLAMTGEELPWRVILHPAIINRTHHLDGLYEFRGYDPLMPAWATGRGNVPNAISIKTDDPAWRIPLLERIGVRYDAADWKPLLGRDGRPAGKAPDDVATPPLIIHASEATLFDVSRNVTTDLLPGGVFGPDLDGRHYVTERAVRPGDLIRNPDMDPSGPEFRREMAEVFPREDFGTTKPSTLLPGEWIRPVALARPDEWSVRVNLQRPALVTLKMTWLPGWRVLLDGEDAGQAMFANNWMPGAIVPAGESVVTFRYRPVGWTGSLVMSCIGSALAGVMLITGCRQRRRRS